MRVLKSLFISLAVGASMTAYGQSPGPDIDRSQQRSYPAGPFSAVSTSFGGLETSVPLFSLSGPGGTSLSFGIRHRSNQLNGTQYQQRGMGRGWFHTYEDTIAVNGLNLVQRTAGGGSQLWANNTPVGGLYTRRAGIRSDLRDIVSGTGTWLGWEVDEFPSRNKHRYFRLGTDPLKNIAYLGGVIDPYGNAVEVYYDVNKRVTRIDDASNVRYVTINYADATINSLVSSVTLNYPGGTRVWTFNYTSGNLTKITWPDPLTTDPRPELNFVYDGNSNITDIYDFRGNRWHYSYAFQPTQEPGTSPLACTAVHQPSPTTPTSNYWANATTFNWTFANIGGATFADDEKICTITEPYKSYTSPLSRVRKHVYYFNTKSDLAKGGNDYFEDPIKAVVDPTVGSATYNDLYNWRYSDGTLTQHTDRRGKTWNFTYDPNNMGLVYTSLSPANGYADAHRTSYFNYDSNRRLILTDAPGRDTAQRLRSSVYYNAQHSVIKTITDPKINPVTGATAWPAGLDLTTQTLYNASGEVTSTWSATDNPQSFSNFDAYGNPQTLTSPSGKTTSLTYNTLGDKLTETPPAPLGTTSYTYDNLGRVIRTDLPGGGYSTVSYDAAGNAVSLRDPNGWITFTTYDQILRVATSRQTVDANPLNDLITSYTYDPSGNVLSTTNPRLKSTVNVYDARDYCTLKTYPDTRTRQWTYDGNGNIVTSTDGKGQVTQFLYNDLGQVTNEQRMNGSTVVYQTIYTYTPKGDRLTMLDSSSTTATSYAYDTASRLLSTYQPIPNKTLLYAYDAASRRTNLNVFAGTATTGTPLIKWTYLFDAGLRLQTVKEKLGTGTEVNLATWTFYDSDQPDTRSMLNGTSTKTTYNSRGMVTQIDHNKAAFLQQRVSYGHDLANSINSYQTYSLEGSTYNTVSTAYTHDRSYRLLTEARSGSIFTAQNYSIAYIYDKSGNRSSVTRNGVSLTYTVDDNDKHLTGDGVNISSYDNNGSPTNFSDSGFSRTATYDRDNRLATLTTSSGTDTYTYNGDGTRVRKVSGGSTTTYLYDGSTLVAEYTGSASTYHASGVSFTNGVSGDRFFYRENALGSNLATVGMTGNAVSRTEYDAYGMELPILAGTNTSHRFAGRHGYYKDDSSGMSLLGQRFYHAKIGKFLTQDPIGHSAGQNLYIYCDNGPLSRVDPEGRDWLDNTANFFGGWGSALTFGGTEYVANGINMALFQTKFDFGGGYYVAGQVVGEIHATALRRPGATKGISLAAKAKTAGKSSKGAQISSWQEAERSLEVLGGKKQYFNSYGTRRFVDHYAREIAHEAKYGYVSLSKAIRQQIRVDSELIRDGRIKGATWHFFRSKQTGKIGPSKGLADELKKAGIKIVIHD